MIAIQIFFFFFFCTSFDRLNNCGMSRIKRFQSSVNEVVLWSIHKDYVVNHTDRLAPTRSGFFFFF